MSVDPPRIGVVLSRLPPFLDARNIIEFIGRRSNICIFLVSGDPAWFVDRGFEVRQTNSVERSLWNSFWSLMFLAFGRLPRSVNNYFLTALYGMGIYLLIGSAGSDGFLDFVLVAPTSYLSIFSCVGCIQMTIARSMIFNHFSFLLKLLAHFFSRGLFQVVKT